VTSGSPMSSERKQGSAVSSAERALAVLVQGSIVLTFTVVLINQLGGVWTTPYHCVRITTTTLVVCLWSSLIG
jgi:hypothetical protein